MGSPKVSLPTLMTLPKVNSTTSNVLILPMRSGKYKYKKFPGTPANIESRKFICGFPDKLVEEYKVP